MWWEKSNLCILQYHKQGLSWLYRPATLKLPDWKRKSPKKPQNRRGKHGRNLRRGTLKRDSPPPSRSHTVGVEVR